MKISEIINEAYHGWVGHKAKEHGTVRRGTVDPALPNPRIEPELRNTDTYMQMRYGMALAAAAAAEGEEQFEQETAWAENIGMVSYTQEEVDRIKMADKLMGVKSVSIGSTKSQERGDVGKTSPEANTSWRKKAK
jgi:hypothetical protein